MEGEEKERDLCLGWNHAVHNNGKEQEKWIKEISSKKRSAIDENLASMKTIDRT